MSDSIDKQLEEQERLLEQRKEARASAEKVQRLKDLQARVELEDEHGELAAVSVAKFRDGQPTMALIRTPSVPEYKRYKDKIFHAKQNAKALKAASEELAAQCWVYPKSQEERDAMIEAFPGLLTPISLAATALAEGVTEAVGKD